MEHDHNGEYKELAYTNNNGGGTPLSESLNKKIDFSTVIHNFRSKPRKIKLKMWIEDDKTKTTKKHEKNNLKLKQMN